ncbi:MAG: hypothetical protein AAFR61_31625 [Bacteroidota bacterium]
MNLKALKCTLTSSLAQIILIDREGTLLGSCHSVADLRKIEGLSAYAHFPLLIGMQQAFEELKTPSEKAQLPMVEFSLGERKGFFDFEFSIHPENPDQIIWLIKDRTDVYTLLQQIQQERNLLLIEKEDLKNGRQFDR